MELGDDWTLDNFKPALHRACNEPDFAHGFTYLLVDQFKKRSSSDAKVKYVPCPLLLPYTAGMPFASLSEYTQ